MSKEQDFKLFEKIFASWLMFTFIFGFMCFLQFPDQQAKECFVFDLVNAFCVLPFFYFLGGSQ